MVGERIRDMRKRKGMTQADLAKKAGIKRATISAAEVGTNNPSTTTVALIASALGCTVAELLGEGAPAAAPSDGLTPTERQLIRDFRALNTQGQEFVLQAVAMAGAVSKTGTNALADLEAQVG